MNRSFLIIFIPAVFVAGMYLMLGIYPPARILIGLGVFLVVGAGVWIWMWRRREKRAAENAGPAQPPSGGQAPPAAPATPPAGQP